MLSKVRKLDSGIIRLLVTMPRRLFNQKIAAYCLLICAGISLLFFQSSTPGFEAGHHGSLSSHGITLAKSLFVKHAGFMFVNRFVWDDGSVGYNAYNRFPLFPFLITGAVAKIGNPSLAQQLYLARQVMNLFLFLAMLFTFMTVEKLLQHPLLSVSLVLMTFSSHFILYYHDMVFNDIPALFGCTIVFYLAVSSRNGIRLWQVALLAAIAISTGWQPYSVLIVWFFADLIHAFLHRRAERLRFREFIRKPSTVALATGIAFGMIVLGLQLVNEWIHVGGSFMDIPSMRSFLARTGLGGYDRLGALPGAEWGNYLLGQIRRIWLMILPFDLPFSIPTSGIIKDLFTEGSVAIKRYSGDWRMVAALVGLSGLSLVLLTRVGMAIGRRLIDWRVSATLGLSGLMWALFMRRFVAFHDFQSIFYIGLPMILFLTLFLQAKPLRRMVVASALAVGATLLFAFCACQDSSAKSQERTSYEPLFREFYAITKQLPQGASVFVDGGRRMMGMASNEMDFYLVDTFGASEAKADFVVSPNSSYNDHRLTNNNLVNLFRNQAPH